MYKREACGYVCANSIRVPVFGVDSYYIVGNVVYMRELLQEMLLGFLINIIALFCVLNEKGIKLPRNLLYKFAGTRKYRILVTEWNIRLYCQRERVDTLLRMNFRHQKFAQLMLLHSDAELMKY